MSSYNTNFANQQGILSQLNSALSPIVQAGPNQMGFSAAETSALNSSAINSTAAQARNAAVTAGQAGGGNTGVTTGGQAQLQAGIASQAGQSLSSQENQIQLASAQQGQQNFFTAENALGGVASAYNPVSYAGAANTAGGTAFGEATTIRNMANQEQAGIGGLIGSALGPIAGGIENLDTTGGSSIGEQFGNFFSGAAGALSGQ